MRYEQFAALCQREWDSGDHGDVIGLDLTGPSLAEFSNDVLSSPAVRHSLRAPAPRTVGGKVTTVLNPVTHSPVTVFGGVEVESDTATVRFIAPAGTTGGATRAVTVG